MSAELTFEIVQKLYQLQEEHAHAFHLFEEGYNVYMNGGTLSSNVENVKKFRQLAIDLTKDFKRISEGISDVEKQFRLRGFEDIADMVAQLGKEEKTRLRLCVELQQAKQDAIANPEITDKWSTVAKFKEQYNRSIQKVNEHMEDLRCKADKIVSTF